MTERAAIWLLLASTVALTVFLMAAPRIDFRRIALCLCAVIGLTLVTLIHYSFQITK